MKLLSFRRLARSFKYAFSGLGQAFLEHNFRIGVFFTILAFILAWYFKITSLEIIIIVLMATIVLSLELINSTLEKVLDVITPRIHPNIKIMKDRMAAAVVISVIGALAVGLIIFIPYIVERFGT